MKILSSAKVNLGLYVYGVRKDGFHNIESLFYPVDESNSNIKSDVITIEEGCFCGGGKVRLLQSGLTIDSRVEDNICTKAYNILDKDFNLPPVNIHLEKNVFIGAGLGGGSSDGVNTLFALNEIFSIGLTDKQLESYASMLGSDCPFFVYNFYRDKNNYLHSPMIVKGRGEILEPLKEKGECFSSFLKEFKFKIIFPELFISTQHAYSVVKERDNNNQEDSITTIIQKPIHEWQDCLINDFEEPIFKEYPQLQKIKNELIEQGALYVSMSGSGSAIYGIFKS